MNIYRPLQVGWVQQCRAVKLLMRVNVNSITTGISALQLAHAVQVMLTRQQITLCKYSLFGAL